MSRVGPCVPANLGCSFAGYPIPPLPRVPDAKAFLFLAGTLVVALHEGPDALAAGIRLTATFKDRSTQSAHIHCSNRRTAEIYFDALGIPEAAAWWNCFYPGPPRS